MVLINKEHSGRPAGRLICFFREAALEQDGNVGAQGNEMRRRIPHGYKEKEGRHADSFGYRYTQVEKSSVGAERPLRNVIFRLEFRYRAAKAFLSNFTYLQYFGEFSVEVRFKTIFFIFNPSPLLGTRC